jgi:hypothetical protein
MAQSTINTFLKKYPALGTAMKCSAIGTVLVATVASGGIIPTITGGAAVTAAMVIGGIAVGAPIVATAAHALEESSFAEKKPVLQKACKFVRVACETSLAIGAGLVASPYLLGISAVGFVAAKAVQKGAEYKISNNNDGDNNRYTMAKNLGSGIASVCAPLALGSALSLAAPLGNIFSSAATPTFAEGGNNVVARTGSALFAASTAAFSGACYVSSASLDNAGFKKAASATRVIGHVALAATAVLASVTAGFAVGEAIYHPSIDDVTRVGSASAAVGGLVAGVGVGATTAGIAAATGVLVANKCCNDIKNDIKNDINNFKELMDNTTTKDEAKGKTDTIKTIDDSEIPSRSPRSITGELTGCKETTSGYLR